MSVPSTSPPLLLLHGFTGSARAWGERILDELALDREVIAVDLPGHGLPEEGLGHSRLPERYRLARVLAGLLALLDSEGIERADWLGYSMGGRIALAAGVHHPGRVRRLVLEGASPGLPTAGERARRRRRDEELARLMESRGIEEFTARWLDQPLFASQARLPSKVRGEARERRLRNDPRALAAVLRGLGTGSQPSYWHRLGDVGAPTLLVTGALDPKFTDLASGMLQRMPRATHRIVPDAGHTVHLEAPEEWLDAVKDFLGEGWKDRGGTSARRHPGSSPGPEAPGLEPRP